MTPYSAAVFLVLCAAAVSAAAVPQGQAAQFGGAGGIASSSFPQNTIGLTTSALFPSLIEPMCADASGGSSQSKDACYGCFSRYSKRSQSEKAKDELTECFKNYLMGTSFEECGSVVDNAVILPNGTSQSFCDFEKCVRKRDVHLAIEGCSKTIDEAKSPVEKFMGTISCVFNRLRCRGTGHDTGFRQQMDLALYMTKGGELRTARLYPGFNSQYSCEYDPYGEPTPLESENRC